jgi:hypothetical protein
MVPAAAIWVAMRSGPKRSSTARALPGSPMNTAMAARCNSMQVAMLLFRSRHWRPMGSLSSQSR